MEKRTVLVACLLPGVRVAAAAVVVLIIIAITMHMTMTNAGWDGE